MPQLLPASMLCPPPDICGILPFGKESISIFSRFVNGKFAAHFCSHTICVSMPKSILPDACIAAGLSTHALGGDLLGGYDLIDVHDSLLLSKAPQKLWGKIFHVGLALRNAALLVPYAPMQDQRHQSAQQNDRA